MRVSPNVGFIILLCLFVLLASALSTIIPLGEAADEVSHQSYVRYVAEHGGMPPVVEGTTVLGETFQPPLYYALVAPLTAWLPYGDENNLGFSNPVESNPDWELGNPERARVLLQPAAARWPWGGEALGWHVVRLFSVLLGVITLFATYRLAALVFPHERWTPLLAAALVAFLPSFTGLSAAVTNDTLMTTLSALLLWQLARLVVAKDLGKVEQGALVIASATSPPLAPPNTRGGTLKYPQYAQQWEEFPVPPLVLGGAREQREWRAWAIVGLLGGLGVWSKASGWLFVGTTILAALLVLGRQIAFGRRGRGRQASPEAPIPPQGPLLGALRATILRLLIAGGVWLLIVIPLWLLNLQRAGDILGRGIQEQVTQARVTFSLAEWWSLLQSLYRTWWAGFGGAVHLHFPAWVQGVLLIPLLIAGWGLLQRHLQRQSAPIATRLLIPLLGAHIGIVFALWLLWSTLVMGTGQGRLLFPALSAIAVLLAGGLVGSPHRPARSPHPPAPSPSGRGGEREGEFSLNTGRGSGARAALAWSVGAFCLALAAFFMIILPTYDQNHIMPAPPASATLQPWPVADLPLALTAFHTSVTIDDRVKPGSDISFYVAWQADGRLPDVRLRLRWIDKNGDLLTIKEGSPIANHPLSDEWQPGQYAAYHHIHLPPQAQPGWYRLLLSVIDPTTGNPLPLRTPDGGSVAEIMVGQMTMQ